MYLSFLDGKAGLSAQQVPKENCSTDTKKVMGGK